MKNKNQYYVVWKGQTPGVYATWKECEKQVKGFENALFKGFEDETAAKEAFKSNPQKYIGKDSKKLPTSHRPNRNYPDFECICVDAACSGNPGPMEYRGVHLPSGQEIFRKGPFALGTNNIGEFLAIVHALALLKAKGSNLPIFSDSRTAISWVKGRKANTKLVEEKANSELFDLVNRAEIWLESYPYQNKILKWETSELGEIPADFGRK
jgi:ribonuclease HI